MRAPALLLLLAPLLGCGNEYHPEFHPQSQYSYAQNVTVFGATNQTPEEDAHFALAPGDQARAKQVVVLQTKHLDRPAEVVGVVDAHEEMGKHEAALWTLKTKAAQLGADAVVGVEFHHGEGEGEPTHLSGLAVRFLPAVPYPVD
jgi:uncharacterized protein YbjQ (UPF0145 family)